MGHVANLWRRLFGPSEREQLTPLYRAVVAAARRPFWYADGGVPDTLDGRFDMVAAILTLVLLRLEGEGDAGRAPAALLTELFVEDMDGQLREAGIGDIVVGKHVGRMMGALGGRLGAFRAALGQEEELDEVIRRNIYRGRDPGARPAGVVHEAMAGLHARLAAMPLAAVLAGEWRA